MSIHALSDVSAHFPYNSKSPFKSSKIDVDSPRVLEHGSMLMDGLNHGFKKWSLSMCTPTQVYWMNVERRWGVVLIVIWLGLDLVQAEAKTKKGRKERLWKKNANVAELSLLDSYHISYLLYICMYNIIFVIVYIILFITDVIYIKCWSLIFDWQSRCLLERNGPWALL